MVAQASFRHRAREVLGRAVFEHLNLIARVASTRLEGESGLYLVGGLVRDVLLGTPSDDIDVVVVGLDVERGDRLARALAAALGGEAGKVSELATWRIELPGERGLDLVSARRESYPRGGALPTTAPGDLADDLARRDFTVNAMAVPLSEAWGEVIDPHGGRDDLACGLLRSLHSKSFRDDPTRALRGLELAVRLELTFEPTTLEESRETLAGGALRGLSAARWSRAWRRSLGALLARGAGSLLPGLRLAREIGLLDAFGLPASRDDALRERATRLAEHSAEAAAAGVPDLVLARALAGTDESVARFLADRWSFGGGRRRRWTSFGRRATTAFDSLAGEATPSRLAAALDDFDREELLLMRLEPGWAVEVERYEEVVAPFRLAIDGRDLEARGYAPGPAFGEALARTRDARLDGRIREEQELEYACRLLEATV